MKQLKNRFNDARKRYTDAFFVALAMVLPQVLKAQEIGKTLVDDMSGQLQRTATAALSILQIILGIGAGVVLVATIVKIAKGEREAGEKLAWWIGGMVIGFILLTFVKRIISGANTGGTIQLGA